MPAQPGAAFFDVDETLITRTSAIDFLDHRMDRSPAARAALAPAAALPRETAGHAYFALYAGLPVAEVAAQGRAWFAEVAAGLFHPPVLAELRAHADHGRPIVLVSGSFAACVDPIAAAVGAVAVLCSRPRVASGVYTGHVDHMMIGAAKAVAVLAYLEATGCSASASYAYGDHVSDLPMLAAVGHPVVVGDDPGLAGIPARRLPGVAPHRDLVTRSLTAGAP